MYEATFQTKVAAIEATAAEWLRSGEALEAVRRVAVRTALWYIPLIYLVEDTVKTAKVFWSGRSQAVRLPKRFRVEGRQVRITRRGNAIILEAIPETWEWLDAIAGTLDKDFVEAVNEQPEPTERPALEKLFR
jgi:antitoxin VapB